MRQFTDSVSRKWQFSLTVAAIKQIRAATGIDLATPMTDHATAIAPGTNQVPLVIGWQFDPVLQHELFSELLRTQVTGANIDEVLEQWTPTDWQAAQTMFADEWLDFFRRRNQTGVAGIVEKATAAATSLAKLFDVAIDEMELEIAKAMTKSQKTETPPTPGESSTSVPASVA